METPINLTFSLSTDTLQQQEKEAEVLLVDNKKDGKPEDAKRQETQVVPGEKTSFQGNFLSQLEEQEDSSILSPLSFDSSFFEEENDAEEDDIELSGRLSDMRVRFEDDKQHQFIWRKSSNASESASTSAFPTNTRRATSPFLQAKTTTDSIEHKKTLKLKARSASAKRPARKPRTRPSDSLKPKRAVTSYNLFFKSKRQELIQETNGSISFSTIGKVIGKLWQECSEKERRKFDRLAKRDMARYRREAKIWREQRLQRMRGKAVLPAATSGAAERSNKEEEPEATKPQHKSRSSKNRTVQQGHVAAVATAHKGSSVCSVSPNQPPAAPSIQTLSCPSVPEDFCPPPFPAVAQHEAPRHPQALNHNISYKIVRMKASEVEDFIAKLMKNNFRLED